VAELMKRAMLALQAAKRVGRGICRVYAADSDNRQQNQMILRNSLRTAIEENQFKLHFHPLVDLRSGTIVGAEALVRWNHPQLGLQRPDIFIPFAESSGLIIPLGALILREAMLQVTSWQRLGLQVPRIAINVSGIQLKDPGLLRSIEAALLETGADASHLELELTEGFMIDASSSTLNVLRELKMLGFTLAVDDFGTGHASFRYLRDFPVDKVKIDQTFVRQMVIDSSDASIIRAIIALAKSLDLEMVAEGIETTIQRNFLREEGCRTGQGYLFSLPLAAEDFAYLVAHDVKLPWQVQANAPASGRQKAGAS
jgi:EAL domain-containing protein (putative c-di-GMP-specific phosphodiesterase class I)